MNLSFSERKQAILNGLDKDGSVKVTALAQELGTSEITIRRDLEKLDQEGLLVKTHGGAIKREGSINEFLYMKQIKDNEDEKIRIGQMAASFISERDVIFMDTGTTTLHIARVLKNMSNITIVTNSILVLSELRFVKDLDVILLGGNYRPGNFALSGPLAENAIKNFRAKYAFLGADGITMEYGVTTNDIFTAQITQLMMQNAESCVLVTDHSKFGQAGSIRYASLDEFDMVITDRKLPDDEYENLKSNQIDIRRA